MTLFILYDLPLHLLVKKV